MRQLNYRKPEKPKEYEPPVALTAVCVALLIVFMGVFVLAALGWL